MKKVFVVLEPEEIVRLQGILMDHDGEEAWHFRQIKIVDSL